MSMDMRQLRYFLAIVEEGSFSRAGSRLNVAQSALSHHVRNMETTLGSQLLMRTTRGVVATETGKILARHARIILDQLALAEGEIRGAQTEPSGEVRLGLPGTISEILSVPLLTEVGLRYPGIRLRIAEAMSGFVLDWMRQGKVDLGVIYRGVADGGLSTVRLLDEELFFFGRNDDIESDGPADVPITFEQIAHHPLIVPGEGHGLRELIDAEAGRAGIELTLAMEVDAYSNIKALVAGGFGSSILPLNAIKRELAAGVLRHRPIAAPALKRSVHLAFSVERPMTSAAAAVVDAMHHLLGTLAARGDWAGVKNLAASPPPILQPALEPS